MAQLVNMCERIVMEKMTKLQDTTRLQLLWLTREMVGSGVAGADRVCFALLKHLPAGNIGTGDAWVYVAESLLNILLDHQEWLEGLPALVDSAVFTYLSILPSHSAQSLASLRQQETNFCVSMLRAKLTDMQPIGRDLLRLLQGVARIPEFTEFWRDLLQQPQTLSPQLTDVHQVLSRRTSRRFIAGRVLPEVEIKLNFLLSKVKFGQHKCYQEWFQKKYLSTPESLLIVPELVRFVCCVIHPPNEILQSDIVPRWAFIGWLLSLCQGKHAVLANAKLALFYDWLAYNPELDNIMNIEPGILLMTNSLRQHPQLSAMLIDFLCRLITTFSPGLEERVREGVLAAFRDILSKEVILSVEPLFESSRFDDGLRQLIRSTFPEFYPQAPAPQPEPGPHPSVPEDNDVIITSSDKGAEGGSTEKPVVIVSDEEEEEERQGVQGEDLEIIGAFSGDEEGKEGEPHGGSSQGFVAIAEISPEPVEEGVEGVDGEVEMGGEEEDRLCLLPESIRETLLSLLLDNEGVVQPAILDEVVQMIREKRSVLGEEGMSVVGGLVARALEQDFATGFRPEDTLSLRESERPSMALCKCASEDESALALLVSLSDHEPSTGYFLLMFLLHHYRDQLSKYKDFTSQCAIHPTLISALVADLKECVEKESSLFFDSLPLIYKEFAVELKHCEELLSVIVANIDPAHLQILMQQLMVRDFAIFGNDKAGIEHLIESSLGLDSFEQFCVWQLLCAEGPDASLVIPAIGKFDAQEHHEALSGAILFLRAEASGLLGVSELFSLPLRHSGLVTAAGSRWINAKPSKYAKYLSHFLDKSGKDTLSLTLTHLQNLLQYLKGNALFEAADGAVAKALCKLFSADKYYRERFDKLFKVASGLPDSSSAKSQEEGSGAPSAGAGKRPLQTVSTKPTAKKRRVINKEDLSDN
ncbi:Integrator complex subunit 3 [Geodia barretti]|nr:Integrator complex subunit 3 [Geodia barretti]